MSMASSIYGINPRHLSTASPLEHTIRQYPGKNIPGFPGFLRQYPFLGIYVVCVHDWEHDLSVDILCVEVCVLGTLY